MSTDHDEGHLWAGPATAQRTADGATADGPTELPLRLCPSCSAQTYTAGEYCPHCGQSYFRRTRRRRLGRRGKAIITILMLLILAGGAAGGYAVKHQHDQQIAVRKHRAEAAERAAQRQARFDAQLKAQEEATKRAGRRALVADLKKSITKDADKDVTSGVLTGPILRTECTPVGGGNVDNLAQHTGNWSCLAVDKDHVDGTSSGYAFAATVNYDSGSYTWHLGH